MAPWFRPVVVLAATGLALAACGDDDDDGAAGTVVGATSSADTTAAPGSTEAPGTAAPATEGSTVSTSPDAPGAIDPADITGPVFVVTAVSDQELVEGSEVRMQLLSNGDVSATGGCNQLFGSGWSLEGDVLVIDGLGQTEKACDPPALMEQDALLVEVLTSRPTVTLDGDTLTLTSGDTVLTLVDRQVADPDRELEGTTWELESLVTADAVSSVPAGVTTPTLMIEGGQLQVHLGCNRGNAEVTVGEGTLEIGPLATTRMTCPGDGDQVEQHLGQVLTGTVEYSIEADQLTLTNGDVGAVYRAG